MSCTAKHSHTQLQGQLLSFDHKTLLYNSLERGMSVQRMFLFQSAGSPVTQHFARANNNQATPKQTTLECRKRPQQNRERGVHNKKKNKQLVPGPVSCKKKITEKHRQLSATQQEQEHELPRRFERDHKKKRLLVGLRLIQ